MKKALLGLAGVIVLLLLGVAGLMFFGTAKLNARIQLEPEHLTIATDTTQIAKGERLVGIYQCTECHGDNLGGADFIASDAFMHLPAPNLTRGAGGLAGQLTPAQWEHAIRHGVGHDGRPLVIMPSKILATLTDADVGAIIAYVEQAPPVDSYLGERRFGPVGRIVTALQADQMLESRQIDHQAPHQADLMAGDSRGLGRYLSHTCAVCHGEDFTGQPLSFAADALAPNLTADPDTGLGSWTLADFTGVLRQGIRPDGTAVNANMPWRGFARLTDEEIAALWGYLRGLPPVGTTESEHR